MGVICDKSVFDKANRKVYKILVRPTILYGLDAEALNTKQKAELEAAGLKMQRFDWKLHVGY